MVLFSASITVTVEAENLDQAMSKMHLCAAVLEDYDITGDIVENTFINDDYMILGTDDKGNDLWHEPIEEA
jgi:hypothetical protein